MQTKDIQKLLQETTLFGALPESIFSRIEKKFTVAFFSLGQTILKAGDPGEAFYIIYSGKVRVVDDTIGDKVITLAALGRGDSFGEQSLLHRTDVSSTVRATGNVTLLKLSSDGFDFLVRENPEIRVFFEKRIERHHELHFLKTLDILSSLTPKETENLLDSIETVNIKKGSCFRFSAINGGVIENQYSNSFGLDGAELLQEFFLCATASLRLISG